MQVTGYKINTPYSYKTNTKPQFCGLNTYVNKALAKTRQISKRRRYDLSDDLNAYAKFIQLKNKQMSTEILDINPNNSDKYIVFFHGVGQNITSNEKIYKSILQKGYGVLAGEYGGFGNSTGKISKKSIKQNSKLILQYLKNKGIKDENISVMGFSMGSFPSVDFTTRNSKTNFLVLISPFNSLKNEMQLIKDSSILNFNKILKFIINKFPASINVFDNIFNITNKLKKIKTPTYIIQSAKDSVVPANSTIEMAKHAKNLRNFVLLDSGGHNIDVEKIKAFLNLQGV